MGIAAAALFVGASSLAAEEAAAAPATAVTPAQAPAEAPLQLSRATQPTTVLPANTEVLLSMNETVTTKGKTWHEGDTFDLSVTQDVMYGDYVVIPKGSRGVGRITWLTSKGAFGKSGKMDVSLEYVQVGGRRIPLTGTYRQEGEGNTVATVGGVIAAGVFAGFITGKSGVIPQGREMMAHTKDDLPLAFDGPPPSNAFKVQTAAHNAPPASAPATAQPAADAAAKPVLVPVGATASNQ
jgi:hypothetical protein